MRADEVRSILASLVEGPVAVVPAGDGYRAWLAGDEARAVALRARLREACPEIASSVSWIAVDRLPEPVELVAEREPPAVADTVLERLVAIAWQEALGVAPRDSDDDFFAAGGHSLLAAEIAARLAALLGIAVPLTMVFDQPTVAEQASWLAGQLAGQAATGTDLPGAPRVRGPALRVRLVVAPRGLDGAALRGGLAAMASRLPGAVEVIATAGAVRRAGWRRILDGVERPLLAGQAWRAALIELGAPERVRRVIALGFDGRWFDDASASLWLDDLREACRAMSPPRVPVLPRRPCRPPEADAALELAEPSVIGWRAAWIAPPLARALLAIGRRQAAPALATLAAVVAVAIARRRGGGGVVLELAAPLRIAPAERATLGALTTTAAIAIDLADRPSLAELVERTSRAIGRGWAAAARRVAGPDEPVADASVSVALPADRRAAGWCEAVRRDAGSPGLAFALRVAPSGALLIRVGHDGIEATADDAAAIAGSFAPLITELVADPDRPLHGVAGDDPAAPGDGDEGSLSPPLPLTHAQERLWFLENLAPGTAANHLQRIYRLEGVLDPEALGRALAAIARRHASLRTVFRVVESSPRQLVAPALPLEHWLDAAPEPAQAAAWLAELAAADHARPFDLARGPLWRTRLCRIAPEDHRLIFTIHHLIVDALSFLVWYRELVEHYDAEVSGRALRLGRITGSVGEVAAWERSPDGQHRIAQDIAFWRDELAGATPLDLPIDHRRPTHHGLGRHEVHDALPIDHAARIRALGRRHGATLNVTLIAAAAALLARHTQRDDLVCIVPASRRGDPGRRHVIGLLLNLLPLRLRLDGDPTFAEIIARTQHAMTRALAHCDAPFERIVAALGLSREPGRQPLYDVIVNMVPGTERLRWGDLRVTLDGVTGSAQPCDLVIGASTRSGGALDLVVRCRADLFAAVTATRMMARLRTLLAAAVDAPHTRLSELPVLPDDERATLAVDWNRTALALPELPVHGLVDAQVRRSPEAVAVIQGDRRLTYRALAARATQLAARIAARVPPHSHVGVLLAPSPELAVAALGVLIAGCVYVPLDPAQPAPRLARLAREVALILTEPATAERVAAPELSIADRDPGDPGWIPPAVSPDAAAYVVFTSGSTGQPKGIATSHRALTNQIVWFARDLPWQPGEVACLRSPPVFVDALWELFGPLCAGIPLVIATADEMADPRLLAAMAERHAVTRMVVVPSLLGALLELGRGRGEFLPALALWLATSEELKPALVDVFFAARPDSRLVNLYGASETADQVACHVVSPGDARAPRTPIGRPIANTQIHVLDAAGRPLPIGVAGELCVTGVGVSERYLGDVPAADQARFTANPQVPGARMYRTGDRGRWRHDGLLEYIGRFDHRLKIRGVRIEPGEVEDAILAHPDVIAAAVTAHPGVDGQPRLVAYLVARSGALPPVSELRRFLRARLPGPLVPTAFVALAALPLGATGKIDRGALPAPELAPIASRPPHGAIEHAVALAWEHVLGRPAGAEDDFFAVGGESLLAAQVGARLADHFAIDVPLAVLFEQPTIAAQAAWLASAVETAPHARIVRIGGAPAPLSFAQERLAFSAALSPHAPSLRVRFALRIEGPLDRDRLERAMAAIAARHDALRTVFTGSGPAMRQRVVASCPRDHQLDDLTELAAGDQRAAIHRLLEADRDRPFALADGPPWRTRLIRVGEHAHLLIVTIHHLVCDGVSLQLWIDEVCEHYAALAEGRPPQVAELGAGPADLAVWQRQIADTGFWDASRAFWRQTLAGAAPLELPLAAPRAGWSTGRAGRVRAQLSAAEVSALGALARREQTTVFGVMLAAAGALLGRLTGARDVVVGTIVASRDRPELRPLIGLFLNPLPLRLPQDGDPTAREAVASAGRVLRAALAHGDVPFERIVADVNPERRPYRHPLFDVVINHHPPAPPPRIAGLDVHRMRDLGAPIAPYELMVRIIASPDALAIQLDFQRERFAESTAADWLARYVRLLRGFAAGPERRLAELPDREA